jgi:hypothetical protein
MNQQPDNVQWVWEQFRQDTLIDLAVDWIGNGEAIMVRDGSYKQGK